MVYSIPFKNTPYRRKGFKHYDDMGNYCVGDCDDLFLKLNIQDLIIPTGNQAMAHKKIMASALRSQTGGNCGIVSDCPRCLKHLFWCHNLSPSEKKNTDTCKTS